MEPAFGAGVIVRSARLLVRNPAIAVPGLVVGAVATVLDLLLNPPSSELDSNFWSRSLTGVIHVVATILSIAYTTGMADAAWRTEHATFGDGTRAFRRDAGHVFVAMIVLFIAGLIATLLGPFSAGISYFVLVALFIYTPAAAVVGERPGVIAARESIEILFKRPGPTLGIVAFIVIVVVAMSLVAEALSGTPYVGPLLATLVLQALVAYITLVIVGEYRILAMSA